MVAPPTGTSTAATTGAELDCHWDRTEEECGAIDGCQFIAGGETIVVDGVCMGAGGNVGWCLEWPVGVQHAPSRWYEVETGRVFGVSNTPFPSPEGWEMCGCEGLGAPACDCDPRGDVGDIGGST